MRYFIRLAYDGSPYHGWQVQPHDVSVQQAIEQAMAMVLHAPIGITGAGRTDTGVNAAMMIAHFDTQAPIAHTGRLVHSLNGILGKSIAIYKIFPVCHHQLDFDLMNEAAGRLRLHTDFTSFSKLHTDVKTNNCKVTHAQWTPLDGERWVFTITADRFLRNMVRAIVGTLIDVGLHKITVNDFDRVIERKDRCRAGQSMPGNALFLWNITYPYPIE